MAQRGHGGRIHWLASPCHDAARTGRRRWQSRFSGLYGRDPPATGASQDLVEYRQIGRGVGQRNARNRWRTLQHGHDALDQQRLELPVALCPPPPRPPSATPADVDLKCASGVGRSATYQVFGNPPPPPIHIIGADLCSGNRAAVGTYDAAADREVAAPDQPPPPVVSADCNRRQGERVAVLPGARRNAHADGL